MAATNDDLLRAFNEVASQLRKQSDVLNGILRNNKTQPKQNTAQQPTAAPNIRAATMRQAQALKSIERSQSQFNKAIGTLDNIQLDKVPDMLNAAMKKSGSVFVREMSENIKNLEDVFKAQDQAKGLKELSALMHSMKAGELEKEKFLALFKQKVEDANIDLTKFTYTLQDFAKFAIVNDKAKQGIKLTKEEQKLQKESNKAMKSLNKEADELSDSFEEASDKIAKAADKSSSGLARGVWNFVKSIGAAAVVGGIHLGKELKEAGDAANRFGVEAHFGAFSMGMVPEQLSELAAANRKTVNALGGVDKWLGIVGSGSKPTAEAIQALGFSADQAKTILSKIPTDMPGRTVALRDSFTALAGGLEAGSRVLAGYTSNVRVMGSASMDNAKAIDEEALMAMRFKYQLGMTADAFGDYTKGLLKDNALTAQRVRMGAKEQKGIIDSVRQRRRELEVMGLSAEAAEEMAKQFSKFAAKSPLERLKESIRTRAFASAMGMGKQGEELSQLKMREPYIKDAQEREKVQKRIIELQQQIADKTAKSQSSFTGDLITSALMQKTNMQEQFGLDSAAAQARVAEGRKQDDMTDKQILAMNKAFSPLGKFGDTIGMTGEKFVLFSESVDKFAALMKGPGGAAASGIGTAALTGLSGGAGGLFGSLLGALGLGKIFPGLGGGGGGGAAAGGGLVNNLKGVGMKIGRAGAVGLVSYVGYKIGDTIGTAIKDTWEETDPESFISFGDTLGGTIDTALSWMGSDAAQRRLDIAEQQKIQAAEEKSRQEFLARRQAQIKESKLNGDKPDQATKLEELKAEMKKAAAETVAQRQAKADRMNEIFQQMIENQKTQGTTVEEQVQLLERIADTLDDSNNVQRKQSKKPQLTRLPGRK